MGVNLQKGQILVLASAVPSGGDQQVASSQSAGRGSVARPQTPGASVAGVESSGAAGSLSAGGTLSNNSVSGNTLSGGSMGVTGGQNQIITLPPGVSLTNVRVGLGWDVVEPSFWAKLCGCATYDVDCDASVFLCDEQGHTISPHVDACCIFYGNLRHRSGAIVHQGDNLTGAGKGDDEQITINLPGVPQEIQKLFITINIFRAEDRNQHFGMIKNAFARLCNMDTGEEICRFNLTDKFRNCSGVIIGSLCRNGNVWEFRGLGEPIREANTVNDFIRIFNGIEKNWR